MRRSWEEPSKAVVDPSGGPLGPAWRPFWAATHAHSSFVLVVMRHSSLCSPSGGGGAGRRSRIDEGAEEGGRLAAATAALRLSGAPGGCLGGREIVCEAKQHTLKSTCIG